MRQATTATWITLVFITCGLLSACGNDKKTTAPAPKKPVTKAKPAQPQKPPVVTRKKIPPRVDYQYGHKRNPFAGPVKLGQTGLHVVASSFTLESLQLTGVFIRGKKKWAFIKTPKAVIFKIKKGSKVGNNAAGVTAITHTHITLVEQIGTQRLVITLTVQEPQP